VAITLKVTYTNNIYLSVFYFVVDIPDDPKFCSLEKAMVQLDKAQVRCYIT